jgi:molybdopterin-containing oxidoreductase family iron-sulfur binding subunit
MSNHEPRRYWKSLDERGRTEDEVAEREFLDVPTEADLKPSRRGFLALAGFGLASTALSSCSRAPIEPAIPLLVQPEGLTPGRAVHYASTCAGCAAGCGVLVRTREGRPVKLEGNPEHPLSRGGLCALGQATILGLYDSQRLGAPLREGKPSSWDEVDRAVIEALDTARQQKRPVRLLTGTVTSPTALAAIETWTSSLPDARHVAYDVLSTSALADAHEPLIGHRRLPRFRFDRADVVLSIDADFLGTWISPVEYTAGYRQRRMLDTSPASMSYHVQVEARMSMTGAKADRRVIAAPDAHGLLLAHVANRVARLADAAAPYPSLPAPPVDAAVLDEIAERLWKARERSLVVCGHNDGGLQRMCRSLNQVLGAYGTTIDVERPSSQRAGNDRALEQLLGELTEGSVHVLVVAGVNPVYDLPQGAALVDALKKVPMVVSLATHPDETAAVARVVCPDRHYLESWSDAEPVSGVACVTQPTLAPGTGTRQFIETLAAWSGAPRSAHDLLRESWTTRMFPRRRQADVGFDAFWNQAVHDGVVELDPAPGSAPPAQSAGVALEWPVPTAAPQRDGTLALVLYPKAAILDGRGALNPWLQELPDPVTKVTWDNYACLSPSAAAALNVTDGDVVRIDGGSGAALELSALIQPGQHDQVVAVALGYGRAGTERFAHVGPRWLEGRPTVGDDGRVGRNAAPLAILTGGERRDSGLGVRVTPTGTRRALAATQSHHMITVPPSLAPPGGLRRQIVQETTLAAFQRDPSSGGHGHGEATEDLWPPDHESSGRRWRLVVDLTACTGCSACVIACQAENNVPVVGRDEVLRHREMHWMRIDRYYADQPDGGVDVIHQPMLCQHCENASCEVVCPVLATMRSEEGLNQQVYNRCVGTRYCANNCAFKVRRFNWFDYPREDRLQNLVLNPDVTVRSRGVMEKCSFCVQRLHEARAEAKRQGVPIADGAAQTACQQSCPAQAITFGDMNDPESKVAELIHDPRHFRVLEEINVRPSVGYLTLVRNRADEGEGGTHHE